MTTPRLKSRTGSNDHWLVAKKMKPGQRGAIKLTRAHGAELFCVRHREKPDGTERLTTVELILERVVIRKRDDPAVSFKLKQQVVDLRCIAMAMAEGARYNGKTQMWRLKRSEVLRMGLKHRIAVSQTELHQELDRT